ncbi:MAG: flagellar basal body-associated FliL family protein [Rhizomicrobium sp.]
MAKDKAKEPSADDADKPEGDAAAQDEPKKGLINKLFGTKKMMMITGGGLLMLLLGIGGGLYAFVFSAHSAKPATKIASADAPQIPLVPPQVAFMEIPDIVVNIQTADGSTAFLKLSVSLELQTASEKAGLAVLMPRVVDQFQSYLRELRVDDLRGSAGVMRIKEELLRRVNVAAAPYNVRDVLLKEMIVQ